MYLLGRTVEVEVLRTEWDHVQVGERRFAAGEKAHKYSVNWIFGWFMKIENPPN